MKLPEYYAMMISRVAVGLITCSRQVFRRHTANATMIILFGLLHVADGVLTYLGLSYADVSEVNPVLNYFSGLLGLGLAITVLKLAILSIIAFIFFDRYSIKSRWGTATLASADTFYSWVVTNNFVLVLGS
jgi:uncharacterized membrane protein